MSSRIWTQAELQSSKRAYNASIWRFVESQYRISTLRLVSLAEQEVLERILDDTKPPMPATDRFLDYLLITPFRYIPARGSRFRRAQQREGAFYGSEEVDTALAEVAFYKFLFRADAPDAVLPTNAVDHTAFRVECESSAAIDLMAPPLSDDSAAWELVSDYEPCQRLADIARAVGVAVVRYRSVRDLLRRSNVALLDASAFRVPRPTALQSWRILLKADAVVAICESPKQEYEIPLSRFVADPRLAPLL